MKTIVVIKVALKALLPLVVVAAAAVGGKKIIDSAPPPVAREQEKILPAVRVVPAVRQDFRPEVETYGTVQPRTEIGIVPQVSGRVVHVSPNLRAGGFLANQEVLVRIEDADYELAKTRAQALVSQAQARLDREKAEAEVARKEWEKFGTGEASPLVLREPQLAEARAALSSATAQLATAQLNLDRTEIVAPFACRVRSESVGLGQILGAGVPIARVMATDFAEVRIAVPDSEIPFLDLPLDYSAEGQAANGGSARPAAPVTLTTTYAGREFTWKGSLVRTEPEVDPRTRVLHVIARVDKPFAAREPGQPPLMPGMYLRARIPGRVITDVVVLPRRTLVGRNRILVVDEENRLRRRTVEILKKDGERVVVTSGVKAGERVSVTRVEPAVEGMHLRVEDEQ